MVSKKKCRCLTCGRFMEKAHACEGFKGKEHPSWKGGKFNKAGYIISYCPTHQYANKQGYVLEHRLVMEKHLDRILDPKEVVHHLNGDTKDNRIENLRVFKSSSKHISHHFKGESHWNWQGGLTNNKEHMKKYQREYKRKYRMGVKT